MSKFKNEVQIDAIMHEEFIEQERVYDFLAGLTMELDQVKVQIIRKEAQPFLNKAFAIIRGEERRRNVMLEKHHGQICFSHLKTKWK